MAYVSTVVAAGYERHLVKLNGALLCVMDVPHGQGGYMRGLAHRWLTGDTLPEQVKVWIWPEARDGAACTGMDRAERLATIGEQLVRELLS